MAAGTPQLTVIGRDFILISRSGRVVTVIQRDGSYEVVDCLLITGLSTGGPGELTATPGPRSPPMPSPFPGMDPFLESPEVFPDLHDSLCAAIRDGLNAVLPPPFYSALAGRVWLEEGERLVVPDVQVVRGPGAAGSGSVAVLEEPVAVLIEVEVARPEESRENTVEIYGPGKRLVTSIELLSLANKFGAARDQYAVKQRQLLVAGVNVVEIDLLRRGPHSTLAPAEVMERRARPYDYHVSISRPGRCQIAPVRLAQPLPTIPVPLTLEVPDAILALQALFARTYDAALYARRVDYAGACEPPLSPEQAAWAAAVLNPEVR